MIQLGAIYGFVLGGLSSHCRSLFGELIVRRPFGVIVSLCVLLSEP